MSKDSPYLLASMRFVVAFDNQMHVSNLSYVTHFNCRWPKQRNLSQNMAWSSSVMVDLMCAAFYCVAVYPRLFVVLLSHFFSIYPRRSSKNVSWYQQAVLQDLWHVYGHKQRRFLESKVLQRNCRGIDALARSGLKFIDNVYLIERFGC